MQRQGSNYDNERSEYVRSEGINPLVRAESLLSDPSNQGKSTEYAHHAVSRSLANST
jgi:hypothetical protein